MIRMRLLRPERGRGPIDDLLEAVSIIMIADVPECLEFHVGHGEQGCRSER